MTQLRKNYHHLNKKNARRMLDYLSVRGNATKLANYLGLRNETISSWIKHDLFPQYTLSFLENLDLRKENDHLKKENDKLTRRNIILKKMVDSI